tara:strand:- start:342 stop:644 length:303 start_codon:yes stop_codon:yes gene_type:complete
MNKARRFFVVLGILLEFVCFRIKCELKEMWQAIIHPRFKFSSKPKYAMQLALVLAIIFLFAKKFWFSIFFLVMYVFFWLYKIYVSGDWKVWYKGKYGLDK